MTLTDVVRTYLQMTDPTELRPAHLTEPGVRVERLAYCPTSFSRYLYAEVGRRYHWVDRLGWSDDYTRAYLDEPGVSVWLLSAGGAPAGYFELLQHTDGSVEIAYFGLLQDFLGRGLGKHMLSVAVEEAWALGATRVWLHTCTLDDPAALPNYLKRGFKPFREERYTTDLDS